MTSEKNETADAVSEAPSAKVATPDTREPEESIATLAKLASEQSDCDEKTVSRMAIVRKITCELVTPEDISIKNAVCNDIASGQFAPKQLKNERMTTEKMSSNNHVTDEVVFEETTFQQVALQNALPDDSIEDVELRPNELVDWRQWSAIDLVSPLALFFCSFSWKSYAVKLIY
ncbi:hypothetical protein BD289DRAFT_46329 [Coniella lustricola]|uniref:Uncharacterized protein n=1 Tax=Coniella lustricola TaxID=2025994 RepID=A0A2T3AIB6_9PEZI|nr:hypothetical protein BD289DRAFT_46329 [Coniella lustricola]